MYRRSVAVTVAVLIHCVTVVCLGMFFWFLAMVHLTQQAWERPSHVEIRNDTLHVNGQPYFVRGVNYNPIPKGQDGQAYPYGDYFGDVYSSAVVRFSTASTLYTADDIWEGIGNKFTVPMSYHKAHLQELSKTFNTIRVYNLMRDTVHYRFLDVCHRCAPRRQGHTRPCGKSHPAGIPDRQPGRATGRHTGREAGRMAGKAAVKGVNERPWWGAELTGGLELTMHPGLGLGVSPLVNMLCTCVAWGWTVVHFCLSVPNPTDGQTGGLADKQTGRQTRIGRKKGRSVGRQADGKADRKADK